jgi:methionine aminotransferase
MTLKQSIFSHMNELALLHNAVNLGQGFPDHHPPQGLIDAVHRSLEDSVFQYFPSLGYPPLRDQISRMLAQDYSIKVDPSSEITVTAGATQGLADAIRSLVGTGDEVILVDPSYDSYAPVIQSMGAKLCRIPMLYNVGVGFSIDWQRISDSITKSTKLLILNNPHNPSGYLMNSSDHHHLEILMEKHEQLHLLGDEVYAHIVFEGSFRSFLKMSSFRERVLVVHSFGKTYHCTGWKLGFVAGSPTWMQQFRKAHEFNVFCVNSLLQKAFAEFLATDQSRHEISSFYLNQRDCMMDWIRKGPFEAIPVQSTYFQWIDYNQWANNGGQVVQGYSDLDQAEIWCQKAGFAAIPFTPFVDSNSGWKHRLMRLCFAKSKDKINLAFTNLYAALGVPSS